MRGRATLHPAHVVDHGPHSLAPPCISLQLPSACRTVHQPAAEPAPSCLRNARCSCLPRCVLRSGLRWNLRSTPMAFGGLVSTSNVIEADEIHVESDADLVWTTRLRISDDDGSDVNGSDGNSSGGDSSGGGGAAAGGGSAALG